MKCIAKKNMKMKKMAKLRWNLYFSFSDCQQKKYKHNDAHFIFFLLNIHLHKKLVKQGGAQINAASINVNFVQIVLISAR